MRHARSSPRVQSGSSSRPARRDRPIRRQYGPRGPGVSGAFGHEQDLCLSHRPGTAMTTPLTTFALRRYLRHGTLPQLAAFEAVVRLGSATRAAAGALRRPADDLGPPAASSATRSACACSSCAASAWCRPQRRWRCCRRRTRSPPRSPAASKRSAAIASSRDQTILLILGAPNPSVIGPSTEQRRSTPHDRLVPSRCEPRTTSSPTSAAEIDAPARTVAARRRLARGRGCLLGAGGSGLRRTGRRKAHDLLPAGRPLLGPGIQLLRQPALHRGEQRFLRRTLTRARRGRFGRAGVAMPRPCPAWPA